MKVLDRARNGCRALVRLHVPQGSLRDDERCRVSGSLLRSHGPRPLQAAMPKRVDGCGEFRKGSSGPSPPVTGRAKAHSEPLADRHPPSGKWFAIRLRAKWREFTESLPRGAVDRRGA